MSKPKYKAHKCKEMESFSFEFHFVRTRMRQELWEKPWSDEPGECVLYFPDFCPFCGKRLPISDRPYGIPQ